MKYTVIPICICLVLYAVSFGAQSNPEARQGNDTQWFSHQMNQPPPNPDKNVPSPARVDDIKQLYQDAKAESLKEPNSVQKVPVNKP